MSKNEMYITLQTRGRYNETTVSCTPLYSVSAARKTLAQTFIRGAEASSAAQFVSAYSRAKPHFCVASSLFGPRQRLSKTCSIPQKQAQRQFCPTRIFRNWTSRQASPTAAMLVPSSSSAVPTVLAAAGSYTSERLGPVAFARFVAPGMRQTGCFGTFAGSCCSFATSSGTHRKFPCSMPVIPHSEDSPCFCQPTGAILAFQPVSRPILLHQAKKTLTELPRSRGVAQ